MDWSSGCSSPAIISIILWINAHIMKDPYINIKLSARGNQSKYYLLYALSHGLIYDSFLTGVSEKGLYLFLEGDVGKGMDSLNDCERLAICGVRLIVVTLYDLVLSQ